MKILFAATSEKAENGAAKCLIELAKELEKDGNEVYVSVPKMGAAGAALGTLIAEVVVLLIQLFFMYRENLTQYLKVDWRNHTKIIMGGVIAGVMLFLLHMNITISNYFVRLLITALVYFSVYLTVLAITKETIFWKYGIITVKNIMRKITKKGVEN